MKAFSAPESPRQRTMRRVPKPVMEKRRRERINHSLETLRLLMLENTRDERLKNPKVEKAEILESVVEFLRAGGDMERDLSREQTCARQSSYRDGMRSCLLRVSRFMATKSQESEESSGEAPPETHSHPSSPGHIHKTLIPAPADNPAPLTPHHLPQHRRRYHPYLSQRSELHCETRGVLSSSAACTHITDPVWRPWPQ